MTPEQCEILAGYLVEDNSWVVTAIHYNRFAAEPILEVSTRMLVPGFGMMEFKDGFAPDGHTEYTHNIQLEGTAWQSL